MGKIVILTGAGISAESGIRTFRASDGLWEEHRIEDVASPDGFRRDPDLVYRFYNLRRQQLLSPEIEPNAAHLALARLEREYGGEVVVVTQNIDDLHDRAGHGDGKLLHMHGELLKARCLLCDTISEFRTDFDGQTPCPACGEAGGLRPHIVWFGEMPLYMDEIYHHLSGCDIFAAIGTSGNVYPAAGFVEAAALHGAHTIELNLEPSMVHSAFDTAYQGPATETVTRWVAELL
ncbi:MAG: NAD-dependent protein deacylase [Micavibrio sp.]|nr:MAG: NAD-dependent protein deacylase [Micavibrio sp.]